MNTDEKRVEYFKEHEPEILNLVVDLAAKGLTLNDVTDEIEHYIDKRLEVEKVVTQKRGGEINAPQSDERPRTGR